MDNYIGPYWSNGEWQESVEFGDLPPLNETDAAARLHDSAYAKFKDERHRIAADAIFSETLKRNGGPKSSLADFPVYGNYAKNRATDMASSFATGLRTGGLMGGLGSLVYTGVRGMALNYDLIKNLDRYKKEVLAFYDTDPGKRRPTTTLDGENIVQVNRPFGDAPITKTQKAENLQNENMFTKKNKVAVQNTPILNKDVVVLNPAVQTYRPLRKKKVRAVTAEQLALFIKYNPGEMNRVRAWLATQQ